MIGIALSPEERKKKEMMLAKTMQAAQTRGVPPIAPMASQQGPLGAIKEKAKGKLAEKAAAQAVGAAMGDPTGGTATAMIAEEATPILANMLMKFFNKGGYVNGPLSKKYKY